VHGDGQTRAWGPAGRGAICGRPRLASDLTLRTAWSASAICPAFLRGLCRWPWWSPTASVP